MFALFLMGCNGEDKASASKFEDPKKAEARERYAEGRRIFLAGDPNNYAKALSHLDQALALDPDHPEALAAWAETISMWYGYQIPEEIYQNAYMRAQRSLRLDPSNSMPYRAGADLFRHHRNPDTGELELDYAQKMIDKALELDPNNAENWYVQGSILLMREPEQALDVFNRARSLNPELPKVYFNLALTHQTIAERMLVSYSQDPELMEENQDLIVKHYQAAVDNLLRYQKMVPGDLGGYGMLGIVYLGMKEYDKAEQLFKKTVSHNPNPDPSQNKWRLMAYENLAVFEIKRKNYEAARVFMEKMIQIDPTNPEPVAQLGALCKETGDEACAEEYSAKLKQMMEEFQKARKEGAEKPRTENPPGG